MTHTVLMGASAAALLSGALLGALGERANFAATPLILRPSLGYQTVVEASRCDRGNFDLAESRPGQSAVRIEQLSNSGSVRPFTRISARLAAIDAAWASENGGEPEARGAISPPARQKPTFVELPSIIRSGKSHPALSPNVSAYAEDPGAPESSRPIGEPLNVTVVPRTPVSQDIRRHVVVARPGDSLPAILGALAAATDESRAILAAVPRRRWFGRDVFSGGEIVTVLEGAQSVPLIDHHILKVTIKRPDGEINAVARTDAGGYQRVAERPNVAPGPCASADDQLAFRQSSDETLRNALYALVRSNQVDKGIVAELIRLCSHDFDLDRPLGAKDTADILYAPDELGQPELVFVALAAQGKARRYYRFTAPDDGSTDFYDESGHSITKFLLRKPVVSGHLGDGFGWRIHPVLHDRRFHEGVDYAAPYSSPVVAAGAGIVEIVGQEPGYGKYIRVRHDLGYETTYAHVAGFARGLKVGDRVRQGETIAYVGSTGLSTGPHLYYEVWINGHRVDPLRIRLSGGRVLDGAVLASFQQTARSVDELVDAPARLISSR